MLIYETGSPYVSFFLETFINISVIKHVHPTYAIIRTFQRGISVLGH